MTQGPQSWLTNLTSELSRRAGSSAARPTRRSTSNAVAFLSGGLPDPRELPRDTVVEATRTALLREGEWALQYGPTLGEPNLVEALIEKLGRDQGIDARPENILITAGASQAVSLATRLLVDPGDVVISEAPTWTGAVQKFAMYGADVREISVDDDGTSTDELECLLRELQSEGKRPSFLYLLPNFQNPSGVTTTLARRKRIVELAGQHGVPVIEDDAYFDLRYDGEQVPTIYSLANNADVLYMGTYSKNMAAGSDWAGRSAAKIPLPDSRL